MSYSITPPDREKAATVDNDPTAIDFDRIPRPLKTWHQWVLWRGADRMDKNTREITGLEKIPIDPQTLKKANTTDPKTWGTFEHCVFALPVALEGWEAEDPSTYRGGGIGFVFSSDDPYTGIDLDKCRDRDTGEIASWAKQHITMLASYTEVTPSGTGVHILVQGALPPKGRRKDAVEMYDNARFFTMTGWHLAGTPYTIEARQDKLTAFHGTIFLLQQSTRQNGSSPQPTSTPLFDDAEILKKARDAKNSQNFKALWAGDFQDYDSQSEADLALCILLAFWTQSAAQIDRLFQRSGLMRDKWNEQRGVQTYGECTIAEALARQTEHYTLSSNGQRPEIRITAGDIIVATNAAQQAILDCPNGPHLYQRAHRLCIIARGVKPPYALKRPPDAPVIMEASPAHLRELATRVARWMKYDKRAKEWQDTLPPAWFVETLRGRPGWPFPIIEGVISTPTLRPDGSLLDTPGYDAATGLLFDANGTIFPPLPARLTLDDARTAIGALQEVFIDFPWQEPAHFSAALAALLSVVARCAVDGCVPCFVVRSTVRGSGKGLLVDTISLIATGRNASRMPQTENEDEERKRLLALALDGDPLVLIDNVTRPLGSAPLDAAITARTLKDHVLGKTETRDAPINVVFFASGNNMQFLGDMARRVVPIDLDPQMEHPEEREDFTHPQLLAWVQQERPRLVVAALTILRAYIVAGRPSQGIKPMGSFEPWSDLIRAALIWTGEPDPAAGRQGLEATSDPAYEDFRTLLHCWEACYGTRASTLSEAIADIGTRATTTGPGNEWNELHDALSAFDPRYEGKGLHAKPIGERLRKWDRRVIDGKRLVRQSQDHKGAKLRIEMM